jgi:hypothetical protein
MVAAEWTRRGQPTALTQTLMALTGAKSQADLLEGISLGYYSLDSSAAPYIFRAATEQNDPVAKEIIAWAGRELGSLALGVIRQLGCAHLEFEVVLVGSLFSGGDLLIEPLRETIQAEAPHAKLVRLAAPPVVGGVLLGMEKAGLPTLPYRARLLETTQELLAKHEEIEAWFYK